jgi:hypothetical protein
MPSRRDAWKGANFTTYLLLSLTFFTLYFSNELQHTISAADVSCGCGSSQRVVLKAPFRRVFLFSVSVGTDWVLSLFSLGECERPASTEPIQFKPEYGPSRSARKVYKATESFGP